MNEYSVINKHKVLKYLCSSDFINHRGTASKCAEFIGIGQGEVEFTLDDLEKRGFLETKITFNIVGKDLRISINNALYGFLQFGGYEQEFKDYKLKESEVLSIIETNRIQRTTIIITTVIIVFGLIIQVSTWVLFRQQIVLQEQQIELEKNKLIRDSLDKSDMIKELNSILKKDTLKVSLIKY